MRLLRSGLLVGAVCAVAVLGVSTSVARRSQALPRPVDIPDVRHQYVRVGSVRLHYAELGAGPPVLLLPGWPEDWHAWRSVAPILARSGRRVVMLDPKGFGRSDKPVGGYDLDTVAAELHAFIASTGLARHGGVDVVTHDIGGWIGYTLASAHPADVRSLVLSEISMPRPGQKTPIPSDAANTQSWHHAFNRLPDLPEALVAGRERVFLDWLFDHKAVRPAAIGKAERAEYASVFGSPGAARAGFQYYREVFGQAGLARMGQRLASPLRMPVLAIGAGGGMKEAMGDSMEGAATNLHKAVLPGCGHYLPEECPQELTDTIINFWTNERL